jgi:hypothetical protein
MPRVPEPKPPSQIRLLGGFQLRKRERQGCSGQTKAYFQHMVCGAEAYRHLGVTIPWERHPALNITEET